MNIASIPTAEPVAHLIEELNKLPGIGPKGAQRVAYYLLQAPSEQARALAEAILAMKESISLCSTCFNITDSDPCSICCDEERDHRQICVVEKPLDIIPLERTRKYKGLYHVLHGVIAPTQGIDPSHLKIEELLSRLRSGPPEEVILANNPNLEGDTTAMYLQRLISPLGIRVTRLARGLSSGSELEYADDITLIRALEGRQEF